jgi:hypothetical protein
MKFLVPGTILACLVALPLRADFSYQEDSKITGGAMAAMMKFAGAFSKQAREPMFSHVYVKGNRIARVNNRGIQVTDVDKETITHIDLEHKTYSVMTFEQMKQQLEQINEKMQQAKSDPNGADMQMNISAKATGQTKDVDGLSAKELMLIMTMQGANAKTGQSGSMDVTSDMWMAPVPGYEEVRELHKLMGQKIGFVPSQSLFGMQRPDMAKNMGELYKEMAKLDGMPVETVIRMGATGSAPPDGSAPSQPATSASNSDSSADNRLARLGALAGGFGGFGRRKKNADQQQSSDGASNNQAPSGLLMELTTHASGFSTASVDGSQFEVPAGFKQVEPEMLRDRHAR